MWRNDLKVAWRSFLKNKSFSIINVLGLAIGLAAVFLIALWIQNQFSYDNFYSNKENIYKLWNRTEKDGEVNQHSITMGAAAQALKEQYPEVQYAARMYWSSEELFSYGDQHIKSSGNQVDPDFLQIFNFSTAAGNLKDMLSEPNNIVLTENLAKKLFNEENPLGKTLIMGENKPFKVSGVLRDLPEYTDFDFSYLTAFSGEYNDDKDWNTNTYFTFVSLLPGTDIAAFNQKIKPLLQAHSPEQKWSSLFLYPMSKMHLYGEFQNGVPSGGRIDQVELVGGIALLILVIACINFMNLSTARSEKRSKEIGLRKVIGATKTSLIKQFLLESILLACFAGLLALLLARLSLPFFNAVLDKPLEVNWLDIRIWLIGSAFVLFTGVLAGIYPAFILSSFQIISSLKGLKNKNIRLFSLQEYLVIFQFAIAVFLIVATLVIHFQIDYAAKRSIGYQPARLIQIPAEGNMDKNFAAIKAELIDHNLVSSVARTGWGVTVDGASTGGNISWEGATPEQVINSSFSTFRVESDFVKTMGLTLEQGRDIDYARSPADSLSVLLNQAAVKSMKLEDPVGKYLKWGENNYQIVGVVKDYILGSPYDNIHPVILYPAKQYLFNILLRTNPNMPLSANLQGIEGILKKFNPNYPFSYNFVDEQHEQKFAEQERTGQIALIFSMLAIFISCLGLFALASYVASSRIKEIGIRKVLGASVMGISSLLSKDFIKLVLLSLLLASPIAWWALNSWLDNFTYRISIEWWVFVLAGGLAVLIALITVSSQAIGAAKTNPIKSLRNE